MKFGFGSEKRRKRGVGFHKKISKKRTKIAPTRRRYGRPPRRSTSDHPSSSRRRRTLQEREESFSLFFHLCFMFRERFFL